MLTADALGQLQLTGFQNFFETEHHRAHFNGGVAALPATPPAPPPRRPAHRPHWPTAPQPPPRPRPDQTPAPVARFLTQSALTRPIMRNLFHAGEHSIANHHTPPPTGHGKILPPTWRYAGGWVDTQHGIAVSAPWRWPGALPTRDDAAARKIPKNKQPWLFKIFSALPAALSPPFPRWARRASLKVREVSSPAKRRQPTRHSGRP